MPKASRVSLIGAGPGDPDLLTLRAHRRLTQAKVVLYDRLVGQPIFDLLPEDCLRISVGKTPERSSISQEEINERLVACAREHEGVVRLKSGDPFILGRGSEEAIYLHAHGIPFEIIPGISSACAAPAHYQIPLTHRGTSQAFVVVTGHEAEGKPFDFDWAAVVKIDTIVILMGVRTRQRIAQRLIDLGRPAEDPMAFIENAYRPCARLLETTVGEVATKPPEVRSPAVTVIGPVVGLRALMGAQ